MLLARPRLVGAAVVGLLALQALPWLMPLQDITRYIVAWNVGVLLYLALVGWMMFSEGRQQIRHWAKLEDEGSAGDDAGDSGGAGQPAAIVMELAVVKDLHGWRRARHILLAILTIFFFLGLHPRDVRAALCAQLLRFHARGLPPGLGFPTGRAGLRRFPLFRHHRHLRPDRRCQLHHQRATQGGHAAYVLSFSSMPRCWP